MTSYLSAILTNTSSRYTSLRQTLLPGSSEADGDTEDDSHICRVLRAYYVEKGRRYPEWLPPDPKQRRPDPQTQPSGYFNSGYGSQQGAVSASYATGAGAGWNGSPTGTHAMAGVYRPQMQGQTNSRRSGGLSDLWADKSVRSPSPQNSLRSASGREQGSQAMYTTQTRQHEPMQAAFTTNQPAYGGNYSVAPPAGRSDRFASGGSQSARLTPSGGRPLPSQREGSYQGTRRDYSNGSGSGGAYTDTTSYGNPTPISTPTPGTQTAQDRLKAKLWGGAGRGAGR